MKATPPILASIQGAVPRLPELRFPFPLDWTVREGEQWAVVGPNGAGKSLIAGILMGRHALKEGSVALREGIHANSIAFKDIHSLAGYRNTYYQQRWHSTENEEIPTVEETLFAGTTNKDYLAGLLSKFGIEDLLPKRLLFLSSGELRKFLLVRALLTRPQLLVVDNPFIGLDAASRSLLGGMLEDMAAFKGLQVVLLLSNPEEIPLTVTHVLPVCNRKTFPPVSRQAFLEDRAFLSFLFPSPCREVLLPLLEKEETDGSPTVLCMEHVTIRYGGRTILDNLDWEVKRGEKWALLGANGSGKSTLLSLVFADNPQAYANSLRLFGRKRGSGESIWDIKKRIGYVSPEMHLYYRENVPAVDIVGSGFFDTTGLFRKCSCGQLTSAAQWMDVLGILSLKERLFPTLSSGEQRLVLLARALVKNPDLLVLDEPMHGLDASNKRKVKQVIEQFCSLPGKTLIYVTHYPEEMPSCVDKYYNLSK